MPWDRWDALKGWYSREVPKQEAAAAQAPPGIMSAILPWGKKLSFSSDLGAPGVTQVRSPESQDFFFSKQKIYTDMNMCNTVWLYVSFTVYNQCVPICTGPWKLYLPPESRKYAIFFMDTELLQHYGTERVSRLEFSPVHRFSHSLDTSIAQGFSKGESSASSPVLELILMALLGKKKEKVRLCGLELFLLALRSDSVQESSWDRKGSSWLSFSTCGWGGVEPTHCLMHHSRSWNTSLSTINM